MACEHPYVALYSLDFSFVALDNPTQVHAHAVATPPEVEPTDSDSKATV